MDFNISEIMGKVASSITEELKQAEMEDDIRDNKSYFKIGDTEYRVKKLNYAEQKAVTESATIKHTELITKRDLQGNRIYFYKAEWIKMMKGIPGKDVEVFDVEIKAKAEELSSMRISATEELDENIKKEKATQLKTLWEAYVTLCMQREDILKDSIESALDIHKESFTLIKALEVNENDNWVKVFKTYSDLEKTEDYVLINTALSKLNKLV